MQMATVLRMFVYFTVLLYHARLYESPPPPPHSVHRPLTHDIVHSDLYRY